MLFNIIFVRRTSHEPPANSVADFCDDIKRSRPLSFNEGRKTLSLTPRQITLVQRSFAKVEPIADQAALIFYKNLFEYDPRLCSYFKHDMKEQGRKLMGILKIAVGSLTNLEKLVPARHGLTDRHVAYGIKVEVYRLVANTMREHSYDNFDASTFKNTKRYHR